MYVNLQDRDIEKAENLVLNHFIIHYFGKESHKFPTLHFDSMLRQQCSRML